MQRQTLSEAEEFPTTAGRKRKHLVLPILLICTIASLIAVAYWTGRNQPERTRLLGAMVVDDNGHIITYRMVNGACVSMNIDELRGHERVADCPTGSTNISQLPDLGL